MHRLISTIIFLSLIQACSSSSNGESESASIVGTWFHDCVEVNDIPFPNNLNYFSAYATYELVATFQTLQVNVKTFSDENCMTPHSEYVGFEGEYTKLRTIESSENIDYVEIYIIGSLSHMAFNLDDNMYYKVDGDLLYFSVLLADDSDVDINYAYQRE